MKHDDMSEPMKAALIRAAKVAARKGYTTQADTKCRQQTFLALVARRYLRVYSAPWLRQYARKSEQWHWRLTPYELTDHGKKRVKTLLPDDG